MRILEKIKTIFQHGNHTQQLQQQELQLEQNKTEILGMRKTIDEYRKTITTLGEKDQERTKTIKLLQDSTTTLITTNEKLTTKIQTMRKDMETQATFMQCVNDAIHTMLAGLSKLPDTMPSLDPNFHKDTQISNMENPPYRDATQEIIQATTETGINQGLLYQEFIEQQNKEEPENQADDDYKPLGNFQGFPYPPELN